jgi:hypothetical protein
MSPVYFALFSQVHVSGTSLCEDSSRCLLTRAAYDTLKSLSVLQWL